MTENYKHLVDKLDFYIKKHNFYQLLKGLIFCIILLISYFIFISVIEYFTYLSSSIRTFLFYFSLLLFAGIVFFYFFIPFFKADWVTEGHEL